MLKRNLDQLEALSKKLKAKTIRTEAPSQSIAATRLFFPSTFSFFLYQFLNTVFCDFLPLRGGIY
jgi:hypothetical protein